MARQPKCVAHDCDEEAVAVLLVGDPATGQTVFFVCGACAEQSEPALPEQEFAVASAQPAGGRTGGTTTIWERLAQGDWVRRSWASPAEWREQHPRPPSLWWRALVLVLCGPCRCANCRYDGLASCPYRRRGDFRYWNMSTWWQGWLYVGVFALIAVYMLGIWP